MTFRINFASGIIGSLMLTACAVTPPVSQPPSEFQTISNSEPIESELAFKENVVGKPLSLIHQDVTASLLFHEDGSATGTLVRPENEPVAMSLDWEWEGTAYCRSGSIGDADTPRKCESVTLFPGVGVLLSYTDSDDPDEYWLFE